jgi:dTDP-glucose 4,6-dehydratase
VFLPYLSNPLRERFRFAQLDLNRETEKIVELIGELRASKIVNFASQGMVAESWDKPEDWYQTNLISQVRLHDQLRHFDFIEKYLHVSTPEVYGSTNGWVGETFSFSPSTPYAISRAACDLHLRSFFMAYNFPVVFTRAANVYGPGQQLYRIVPKAMLSARLGRKLPLDGGGISRRCFIHISDVCRATAEVMNYGIDGTSYHISGITPVSIRELVERIAILTQCDSHTFVVNAKERLGKDQDYLLDTQRIRSELGWSDQISLDEGLKETLAWVDGNIDVLSTMPMNYIHKS